jgi:hypothetical protein
LIGVVVTEMEVNQGNLDMAGIDDNEIDQVRLMIVDSNHLIVIIIVVIHF